MNNLIIKICWRIADMMLLDAALYYPEPDL